MQLLPTNSGNSVTLKIMMSMKIKSEQQEKNNT